MDKTDPRSPTSCAGSLLLGSGLSQSPGSLSTEVETDQVERSAATGGTGEDWVSSRGPEATQKHSFVGQHLPSQANQFRTRGLNKLLLCSVSLSLSQAPGFRLPCPLCETVHQRGEFGTKAARWPACKSFGTRTKQNAISRETRNGQTYIWKGQCQGVLDSLGRRSRILRVH